MKMIKKITNRPKKEVFNMVKVSHKRAMEMVRDGKATEAELSNWIQLGLVSQSRSDVSRPKMSVPHNGGFVEVVPTLYFKGGKGVKPTAEMNSIRADVNKVFTKYSKK